VYDARHGGHLALPGRRERGEEDPPAADPAVNEAYEGSGATYDFYLDVFNATASTGRAWSWSPRSTT
jgi:Zn-dependent metalloprotease